MAWPIAWRHDRGIGSSTSVAWSGIVSRWYPLPDLPEGPCPEIQRIVREEIDRLPENDLAPLLLCYFHDLTHQEAAKHLGWPAGTVKVCLVRGRNLLRERLERRGIGLGLAFLLFAWKHDAKAAVTPELRESTVLAMGRSKATEPIRPGAVIGPAPVMRSPYPKETRISTPQRWMIAGLFAVLVGISGHFAFARPTLMPARDASSLPANLTDVLGVDCR